MTSSTIVVVILEDEVHRHDLASYVEYFGVQTVTISPETDARVLSDLLRSCLESIDDSDRGGFVRLVTMSHDQKAHQVVINEIYTLIEILGKGLDVEGAFISVMTRPLLQLRNNTATGQLKVPFRLSRIRDILSQCVSRRKNGGLHMKNAHVLGPWLGQLSSPPRTRRIVKCRPVSAETPTPPLLSIKILVVATVSPRTVLN